MAMRLLSGVKESPPKNLSIGIGIPPPPRWLPAEAKREWRRIVKICHAHPIWLQHADRAALVAYCIAWSTYREAAASIARDGVLVPGRSPSDGARAGLVKNPAVQIVRDAGEQLRRWSRELGFTPDSRQRIAIGPEEEPDYGLFD